MSEPTFEEILEREEKGLSEIEELFHEESFLERFAGIFKGFAAARDSRAYKVARGNCSGCGRRSAPCWCRGSVTVLFLVAAGQGAGNVVEVEYLQREEIRDLGSREADRRTAARVHATDMEFVTDTTVPTLAAEAPASAPEAMTAQPAAMDRAAGEEPVIMRNMVGVTRNAGMRGQLLKTYGGNQKTETP